MAVNTVSVYFIAVLKKGETLTEADFTDKTKTVNYLTQDHFNNIFSESIEKRGRWESMEKDRAIKVANFFNECAQYISVDKTYQVFEEVSKYSKIETPTVVAHPNHDVVIEDHNNENSVEIED